MDLKLQGKIALVTGSNRGTGEVIAKHLQQEGAIVVRHSNEKAGAESMQKQLPDSLYIWGDLATEQGGNQCLKQLWDQVKQVDILVNNYGTATGGRWDTFKEDDWLDIYQKNVLSSARLISGIIPNMKTLGWGRIIQLSTIGSINPNSRMPHYYASKAAMSNMTVSLAKELSNSGITVNTVSPGLILTEELQAGYILKAQRKGWGTSWEDIEKAIVTNEFPNPSGRIAKREEIADLVCFLASDKAGFINGQNIRVDGGAIGLTV